MTDEQEKHLSEITAWISEQVQSKYRSGQAEHGGNLWVKPCLPHAIAEVTDLVVYMQTLERQAREAHDLLQNAIAGKDWKQAAEALAMLTGQLRPPVE